MTEEVSRPSSPRTALNSGKVRSVESGSSLPLASRSAVSTGSSAKDAEPSRPGSEASSQAQSKSATTSSRAETILRQTSQIGHLSVEARQRLIGIEGSLKALAGEDGEIEENPVIEALDLIVQMLAAQSQRLDRMEDTLEHLVQVVSADGSSGR